MESRASSLAIIISSDLLYIEEERIGKSLDSFSAFDGVKSGTFSLLELLESI